MNKIIYSLVYNRKKCLNKRGMALVQVEAYLDRKKKYFSTKVYLKPEQWDAKKLVVKNHPNADALNRLIYEFVAACVIYFPYLLLMKTMLYQPGFS